MRSISCWLSEGMNQATPSIFMQDILLSEVRMTTFLSLQSLVLTLWEKLLLWLSNHHGQWWWLRNPSAFKISIFPLSVFSYIISHSVFKLFRIQKMIINFVKFWVTLPELWTENCGFVWREGTEGISGSKTQNRTLTSAELKPIWWYLFHYLWKLHHWSGREILLWCLTSPSKLAILLLFFSCNSNTEQVSICQS